MIGHLPESPHTVYTQVMMHPKGPGNANVVDLMCGDIVYLKEIDPGQGVRLHESAGSPTQDWRHHLVSFARPCHCLFTDVWFLQGVPGGGNALELDWGASGKLQASFGASK